MKKIWMLNHYATTEFDAQGGRAYCISEYLKKAGYEPEVFCASTLHRTGEQYVDLNGELAIQKNAANSVPYIFIKTRSYKGNGKSRILNIWDYYKNVVKVVQKRAKESGNPDVIYASSVHPLALVAGIKLAKKYKVKCVCEVRDLWPESLIAYGILKKESIMATFLYALEKWIYRKADRIIMTWPGGYEYIEDRGWQKVIPQSKVICISNGVDLVAFEKNKETATYTDKWLKNNSKNFVYAGSIRQVNNLSVLIDVAEIIQNKQREDIRILVYGDGNERESLISKVKEKELKNIVFVGLVRKEQVPSLLSLAYVTILHNSSTSLDKYGQSQNKFFEYLAAGKPILMTYSVGHSICKENNCGIEVDEQTPSKIGEAIISMANLSVDDYAEMCNNCLKTANQYDYKALTDKVISVIESL